MDIKLLSMKDVSSKRIKIKEGTLKNWVNLGIIPGNIVLQIGSETLFREHLLELWLGAKELLTIKDVLKIIPNSKDQTIRTLIRRGKIPEGIIFRPINPNHPEKKINGVRFRKEKLEAWIYGYDNLQET